MKQAYIEKNFSKPTLVIIDQANDIIDEYQAEGFSLTLRQLYYQFVSRDLISNKVSEYKRLGSILNDARLAGLVDWSAIEDRTRNVQGNNHWTDVGQIIRACANQFRLDHWKGQEYRPEVWIEKEALIGVIAPVCEDLDVNYFACKGYVSASEMWSSAQRFGSSEQRTVILHLGDHDPSGMDMTRDIEQRQDLFDGDIILKRLALNMDQVEEFTPPPNPAKLTDTRATGYIDQYGSSSWELDALEPRVMAEVIREAVLELRDPVLYARILDEEQKMKDILWDVEQNWESM